MTKALIAAYVPVIHDGYLNFFDRYPDADILIYDETITAQFDYVRKDIRALPPQAAARLLNGLGRSTRTINSDQLADTITRDGIILPDDDISRTLLVSFPNQSARLEPVFLRWDRDNVTINVSINADREISIDSKDAVIQALGGERLKSTNWWRRVAAAVVDELGEVIAVEHNGSTPTEYSSAIDGDPRITSGRGEAIERSIDIHAEAKLIASIAKQGNIALTNKLIYVTTFPCPNCAKLIAQSGFSACYFIDGYATLDGESVLRAADVTIVKVITQLQAEEPTSLKPYNKSDS